MEARQHTNREQEETVFHLLNSLVEFVASLGADAKKNYHIQLPLCIGYKLNFTKKQFEDLILSLDNLGISYTIYLSPNQKQDVDLFEASHKEALNRLGVTQADLTEYTLTDKVLESDLRKKKVVHISHWRATESWARAEEGYQNYYNNKLYSKAVNNALNEDVKKFAKNHQYLSDQIIREHYLLEVKDYVSFMGVRFQTNNNNTQENIHYILVYGNKDLPQILKNANSNAEQIEKSGEFYFVKDSLPHYTYTFKPARPSNQKQSTTNEVQQRLQGNRPRRSQPRPPAQPDIDEAPVPLSSDSINIAAQLAKALTQNGTIKDSGELGRFGAVFLHQYTVLQQTQTSSTLQPNSLFSSRSRPANAVSSSVTVNASANEATASSNHLEVDTRLEPRNNSNEYNGTLIPRRGRTPHSGPPSPQRSTSPAKTETSELVASSPPERNWLRKSH